jgi:hypothetical protein
LVIHFGPKEIRRNRSVTQCENPGCLGPLFDIEEEGCTGIEYAASVPHFVKDVHGPVFDFEK